MRFFRVLVLLVVAMLAGCVAMPTAQSTRADTVSGLPELLFAKAPRRDVIDKIVASRHAAGMRAKTVTDSMVVVGKLDSSFAASFFAGSRYDSTPEMRVTYTITESSAGVMVYSRAEVVTNPNSAYERVRDVTEHLANKMQAELLKIRADLGG